MSGQQKNTVTKFGLLKKTFAVMPNGFLNVYSYKVSVIYVSWYNFLHLWVNLFFRIIHDTCVPVGLGIGFFWSGKCISPWLLFFWLQDLNKFAFASNKFVLSSNKFVLTSYQFLFTACKSLFTSDRILFDVKNEIASLWKCIN